MKPSLPDRAGEVLPPPFPEWLVRQDSLLANAQDNPVHDAFRRRRVAHRRSWFRLHTPATPGTDLRGRPTLWERTRIGLAVLPWLLLSLGTAWPALALASGHINRRGHSSGKRLPLDAGGVCSIFGGHRTALTDLYMSGCKGSEIVGAIYAECLEYLYFWRLMLVGVVLGLMLLLGAGLYFDMLFPVFWIAGAMAIACALAIYHRLPVELLRFTIVHHVEPSVIYWAADSNLAAMKRHLACVYWRQFRTFVAVFLIFAAFAVFAVAVAPWIPQPLFGGVRWYGMPPLILICLIAALIPLGIWAASANSSRVYWTSIGEQYLREADAAFEHYMRDVVLED